jgi:hypothetical protein
MIKKTKILNVACAVVALALPGALPCSAQVVPKQTKDVLVIAVSPDGSDLASGTREKPFQSLQRAQQAVREASADHDVTVELANGIYRLSSTLLFTALDGGRNGHHVLWTAVQGAKPVISGAESVTGWKLFDKEKQIYVANVPAGMDSRELWVDDELASRASIEVPRSDVEFTQEGIVLKDAKYNYLAKLSDAARLEVESTGFFTDRFSPVEKIAGHTLMMKQPAWNNNIWGYDSMSSPYHPELSHLYLRNALAFISKPGQWYLDPIKGKLYLRPPSGSDVNKMHVELPRLTVLMAIGNSLDAPVQELTFSHIRFSHTTWLGPETEEGYASQQSGSFLTGRAIYYPKNPLVDCKFGCPAFETARNTWNQMPASIQIAAAAKITFENDIFAHLGQYALGIGNDSDANLTGVGLGTSDITITRNVFTDLAGGAIVAGGVRRDAHHPSDPRQINRQLIVWNNRIRSVSKEYRDQSAILSTYVSSAVILHNDISDVPYDAIDVGYGWGMHDAGGNANYRVRMHGYDFEENLVYDMPTTHRDVVVASNRVHGAKQFFHDGGAIYNLSAGPGTLITENYIFDNSAMIGLYLDEGSRYITVRRNVVEDKGSEWLNVNTVHSAYPLRISPDNTAISNWHDGTQVGGLWNNYQNNLILDDHLVTDGKWPIEALEVMKNSGIEPSAGPVEYGDATVGAGEVKKP